MEKYWIVKKYCINNSYNKKYPVHAIVKINGEEGEHFWMLPAAVLRSDSYDFSSAIKTENIWS